jgi:hypothetical protein
MIIGHDIIYLTRVIIEGLPGQIYKVVGLLEKP